MSFSPGLAAFELTFQLSPIILVDGIATNVPGGMLPIISITEAANFVTGLLSGGRSVGLQNAFANFEPLSGASLIDQQIGHYPFANQAVAANAVVTQPLSISMLMKCPARPPGGYAEKLATLTTLRATLAQHNISGGSYILATPSYFYSGCVMLRMTDVTAGASRQPQSMWRIDFEQPLLTLAQAQQAQNAMMSKISGGVQTDGALSGLSPAVGAPSSLAASSVVGSAQGTGGAGVAPVTGGL